MLRAGSGGKGINFKKDGLGGRTDETWRNLEGERGKPI